MDGINADRPQKPADDPDKARGLPVEGNGDAETSGAQLRAARSGGLNSRGMFHGPLSLDANALAGERQDEAPESLRLITRDALDVGVKDADRIFIEHCEAACGGKQSGRFLERLREPPVATVSEIDALQIR